jgi:hypothetical protein
MIGGKRLAGVAALVTAVWLPMAARGGQQGAQQAPQQQEQQAVSRVTLTGTVHTSDGTPIPGASLTVTNTQSGQKWLTWSDENGRYELHSLPVGAYHAEATELGFDSAAQDFELATGKTNDVAVTLRIATLTTLAAASNPTAAAESNPGAAKPAAGNPANPTPPPSATAATPPAAQTKTAQNQAGRGGNRQGGRGGAGAGGFQQLDVSGQGAETAGAGDEAGADQQTGVGQSADAALVMSGSVGEGQGGGFPFAISGDQSAGGQFGDQGAANFGSAGAQQGAGQLGPPGGGAQGGNMGGGPGGGGRGQGGGRGGPGGGRGGAGRGQGPGGVPWGLQRAVRQRANQTHFSLYNIFGDSVWNARPFSLQGQSQQQPSYSQERFGGNLGGPFKIPKLYDGRDKTFVFLNVDVRRNGNPVDDFSTVPTVAERSGNFCGAGITLYDYTSNFDGPRTALPCNISGMINPISAGLLQYVPQPNLQATTSSPYNYLLETTVPNNYFNVNGRVIQTISPKLNFIAVYNISQNYAQTIANFPGLTGTTSSRGQNVTLSLNQNLTQRLINSTSLNFTRQRIQVLNPFSNTNDVAGQLGITGISTAPIDYGIPQISLAGFTGLNDPVPALHRNQTYIFNDTVTYTLPKHTLHIGVQVRRLEVNTYTDPDPLGTFTFTGYLTEQLAPNPTTGVMGAVAGTGSPLADFLLGLPQSTNEQFGSSSIYLRNWGFVGYATDDWHIRPSLTLTYGLRWESVTPPTELYGHLADLDVNSTFTSTAVVTPGETAPYSGSLPDSLIRPDWHDFAPRLALAWRVPGKMFSGTHALTVRSGYAMFYNSSIYNTLAQELANQPPWAVAATNATTASQILTLADGFPCQGVTSTQCTTNTNTVAVNPNYRNGYVQIWNLGLESQIFEGLMWNLTYQGTKGTDLDLLTAPNRLPPGVSSETGTIANANGFTYDTYGANSIYHALQANLIRRMHNGMTFNVRYAYGKSIDDASSIGGHTATVVQQFPLFDLERGLSTFDIRHTIRGTYTYELPFGERKKWAHSGWEDKLLSNWRVSGNAGFQTGLPFTAQYNSGTADFSGSGGNFSTRTNQLFNPNLPYSERTPLVFFNTAAFAAPPSGDYGDGGRDTIEGPRTVTWNAQLARTVTMGRDGRARLDLRWEVNNVLNHANFTGLNTLFGSPSFGSVVSAASMRTMDMVMRFNF